MVTFSLQNNLRNFFFLGLILGTQCLNIHQGFTMHGCEVQFKDFTRCCFPDIVGGEELFSNMRNGFTIYSFGLRCLILGSQASCLKSFVPQIIYL